MDDDCLNGGKDGFRVIRFTVRFFLVSLRTCTITPGRKGQRGGDLGAIGNMASVCNVAIVLLLVLPFLYSFLVPELVLLSLTVFLLVDECISVGKVVVVTATEVTMELIVLLIELVVLIVLMALIADGIVTRKLSGSNDEEACLEARRADCCPLVCNKSTLYGAKDGFSVLENCN